MMEYRRVAELKTLEKNPRVVRDAGFRDLCESLKRNPRFFDARPIILSNRTGELCIIAGNTKFEAAKVNKMREVPTELITDLTEEEEREIIIRDNAHAGDWDYDALKEWSDLPLSEWGVPAPTGGPSVGAGGEEQEVPLKEIDPSEVQDRFWMSITGPLPKERDALEKLVEAMRSLPGVEVQVGTTEVGENEYTPWTP